MYLISLTKTYIIDSVKLMNKSVTFTQLYQSLIIKAALMAVNETSPTEPRLTTLSSCFHRIYPQAVRKKESNTDESIQESASQSQRDRMAACSSGFYGYLYSDQRVGNALSSTATDLFTNIRTCSGSLSTEYGPLSYRNIHAHIY
jgi:hypothetical protein